ncbi:unnamed protein product [Lathyrus oleraceus]
MMFSKNINQSQKQNFKNWLGILIVSKIQNYLEMPTLIGHSNNICFSCLMDIIRNKFKVWKTKILSYIGRTILIKVVASVIPIYEMSYFQLPRNLCHKMDSLLA